MNISDIKVTSKRGDSAGKVYTPHMTKDGTYIATKTRFQKDYVYVTTFEEIVQKVNEGLGLRMSPQGGPASLISAARIKAENPSIFG